MVELTNLPSALSSATKRRRKFASELFEQSFDFLIDSRVQLDTANDSVVHGRIFWLVFMRRWWGRESVPQSIKYPDVRHNRWRNLRSYITTSSISPSPKSPPNPFHGTQNFRPLGLGFSCIRSYMPRPCYASMMCVSKRSFFENNIST